MRRQKQDVGQRTLIGSFGALLPGLSAVFVQFWWTDVNWWVVGGCAAFGFLLAWFEGDAAIELLKGVFRWS